MHDYENYEKLSALIDGESDGTNQAEIDQLLERVAGDDRYGRAWQAWHLSRDILQNDYCPVLSRDFCCIVSAELDSEEIYAKPITNDQAAVSGGNVLPIGTRAEAGQLTEERVLAQSNRRWKSVAGLAVAASVVLATVMGFQLYSNYGVGLSNGPEIAWLSADFSAAEPVAPRVLNAGVVPAVLVGGGTHWLDSGNQGHALKVEQQLNSYLTNHLQDATMGNVSGMISHKRVVGYDANDLQSESF